MSPDLQQADVAPDAPLAAQLDSLAAYIRDPAGATPPAGLEPRRLRVYRDLFLGNMRALLAGNFPVARQMLDEGRWDLLVDDFYREHASRTPLFPEVGQEFLAYLAQRNQPTDPPWLHELAHYEWLELALQISPATCDGIAHDPDGDLLAGAPVVSPLAWPVACAWPVHRLGPEFQPEAAPAAPTLLLLRREADGEVSFHELGALSFRLLQCIEALPTCSGRQHLLALAREADTDDVAAFVAEGAAMLAQWHRDGTVLGTRGASAGPGAPAGVC